MSILENNIELCIHGEIVTADIFPSYILEPKKIIESITWFLNPIEEPPQKFLQIMKENNDDNIYANLLEKEGFIIKNTSFNDILSHTDENSLPAKVIEHSYFNVIFSLGNELVSSDFEMVVQKIHTLLKPSSYFIYELKIGENINKIREIILQTFETVNFLVPWSELNTNPFSPFNKDQSNYCWIVALSKSSDDDPAEWIDQM